MENIWREILNTSCHKRPSYVYFLRLLRSLLIWIEIYLIFSTGYSYKWCRFLQRIGKGGKENMLYLTMDQLYTILAETKLWMIVFNVFISYSFSPFYWDLTTHVWHFPDEPEIEVDKSWVHGGLGHEVRVLQTAYCIFILSEYFFISRHLKFRHFSISCLHQPAAVLDWCRQLVYNIFHFPVLQRG